jgi:hypothetical protein
MNGSILGGFEKAVWVAVEEQHHRLVSSCPPRPLRLLPRIACVLEETQEAHHCHHVQQNFGAGDEKEMQDDQPVARQYLGNEPQGLRCSLACLL